MIKTFGFEYIFLRPSYFMQNLTSSLINDIRDNFRIVLPAGKARFNWIDTVNIGEVAALLLRDFGKYKNSEIELTGSENVDFKEVCRLISSENIKM
jgi:uncharacterized protein YbjT (DUF2867 family)